MKKRYGDKAHLLFTDTDSLMYEIETEDLYADFATAEDNVFDFSNYPPSHSFFKSEFLKNKAQVGLMKDEAAGLIINEFVGLRPKMYSYTTCKVKEDGEIAYGEKHRAKGIQKVAAARFKHSEYLKQLQNPEENYVLNRRLGSKLHRIYGIEVF